MFFLPQRWPWALRDADELPREVWDKLSDNERGKKIMGGQTHWVTMVKPTLSLIAITVAAFWIIALTQFTALLLVVLFQTIAFGFHLVMWRREPVFITNKRVIVLRGLFTRHVAMAPLSKLTDMDYVRTPVGYLLGFGTLRLETAGQNQALEKLKYIPDPDRTYRHIQNLLFKVQVQDVSVVEWKATDVDWRN